MAEALVIVESPAKAKTINKFLGKSYKVLSSKGHVRDLPRNWNPKAFEEAAQPPYVVLEDRHDIVQEIAAEAGKAERIVIATDPDREGEAIGWHLAEVLRESGITAPVQRVRFNEITRDAVQGALEHATDIDVQRVDAQQARRVIDRVMGYGLSQLLWKKILRGLSGGRVQSVALRLISEREDEIDAFVPEEYWIVSALLSGSEPPPFSAKLVRASGEAIEPGSAEEVARIRKALQGATWSVSALETKERRRMAPPPYTTSKFQQDASRRGMAVRKAMMVAQGLYEGREIAGRGQAGLITYMRTDSTRVSEAAIAAVREHVASTHGPEYVPDKPVQHRAKKDAQDAHEAIRPTYMDLPPSALRGSLTADELRVYGWIWNRFVASQMKPALFDETIVTVAAAGHEFEARGLVQKFAGFLRVYQEPAAADEATPGEDEAPQAGLPRLAVGDVLKLEELKDEQKFTQPPPRYTEATLVKALEENGIGRPSTYAEILAKLGAREYTVLEDRKFRPTLQGREVCRRLVPAFSDIIDTEYTSRLEEQLDEVESSGRDWRDLLRQFDDKFRKDLRLAESGMEDVRGGIPIRDLPPNLQKGLPAVGPECPKCTQGEVKLRFSRNGEFLACSRYPECDWKKDLAQGDVPEFDEPCPWCSKPMAQRFGRFGAYLACPDYPKTCRGTARLKQERDGSWKVMRVKPLDRNCPRCNRQLLLRENRSGEFVACSGYPDCDFIEQESTGISCPRGDSGDIVVRKSRRGKPFYGCSRYPECDFVVFDLPEARPCPTCKAAFTLVKETKKHGTIRYCHREDCDWTDAPEGAPKIRKASATRPRPPRRPPASRAGARAGRTAAKRAPAARRRGSGAAR